MNFTREPIIETVITPREGCKLVIRSSKGGGQEDYFVDAVEVVSFGHSFFFRSQERPKSFLVPVSDYEVLEVKETRMVLKNVAIDRSIKIGGGREASRPREEESGGAVLEPRGLQQQSEPQQRPLGGKRDKRRRGGRRGGRHEHPSEGYKSEAPPAREQQPPPLASEDSSERSEQAPYAESSEKSPSFISKLFPPPPTLIKESLSRYKPAETEDGEVSIEEKTIFEETIFEHPLSSEKEDENEE